MFAHYVTLVRNRYMWNEISMRSYTISNPLVLYWYKP